MMKSKNEITKLHSTYKSEISNNINNHEIQITTMTESHKTEVNILKIKITELETEIEHFEEAVIGHKRDKQRQ